LIKEQNHVCVCVCVFVCVFVWLKQVEEMGIARHVFDDKEGGFDEPETTEPEGLFSQLSVCLSVSLSICLSVGLSVCLSVCRCVFMCVCLRLEIVYTN